MNVQVDVYVCMDLGVDASKSGDITVLLIGCDRAA